MWRWRVRSRLRHNETSAPASCTASWTASASGGRDGQAAFLPFLSGLEQQIKWWHGKMVWILFVCIKVQTWKECVPVRVGSVGWGQEAGLSWRPTRITAFHGGDWGARWATPAPPWLLTEALPLNLLPSPLRLIAPRPDCLLARLFINPWMCGWSDCFPTSSLISVFLSLSPSGLQLYCCVCVCVWMHQVLTPLGAATSAQNVPPPHSLPS